MRHTVPTARLSRLPLLERGHTPTAVDESRRVFGSNNIVEQAGSGWWAQLRDTAKDPMIWFLIGTATIYAFLGDATEAAVLGFVTLPIAGMDIYLHRRTVVSTEGLSGRLASTARVLRDNEIRTIPAVEIVPGDIAVVSAGESFPADGVIVQGDALQAEESALTGESFPVRKHSHSKPIAADFELNFDDENWGSAGTRLLTGEARLAVLFTGPETLYGQIVRSIREGSHERTPLQHAVGNLVGILVIGAVLVCLALAATRYLQGHGALDAFLSAVTLAVAALPEEFPVVLTFFLGVGVYRLARQKALVRRAVVVENIGRVTCICCDKTGTLTEGQVRLAHLVPADGVTEQLLGQTAATASRSDSADPLDVAVLGSSQAVQGERLATFPFTEDRRREVAIVREASGQLVAAAKGAPETILGLANLTPDDVRLWQAKTAELAATGHKVIACAKAVVRVWEAQEPTNGYSFLGLIAFEDPLRAGVAEAVQQARAAGIRVVMVTGDHPVTAGAIAGELGLDVSAGGLIEGPALAEKLRTQGAEALRELAVVARAVPSQKADLVRALQGTGEIVAVTGDGVNDAPALRGADIGIAMGERGTRPAREVASIVLLDDNFRTIVRAIAEGRQLSKNLRLSFAYLLMIHLPLVATAAIIPFAGFPLLYLPVHVAWLELIIHPTALLAFQEQAVQGKLEPVERTKRVRFFAAHQWALIAVVAALTTGLIGFGYQRSLGTTHDVEHARTMAIVVLILASVMVAIGLSRLRTRASMVSVITTVVSAIALVQIGPIAAALRMRPLHIDDWVIAAVGGAIAGVGSFLIRRPGMTGDDESKAIG